MSCRLTELIGPFFHASLPISTSGLLAVPFSIRNSPTGIVAHVKLKFIAFGAIHLAGDLHSSFHDLEIAFGSAEIFASNLQIEPASWINKHRQFMEILERVGKLAVLQNVLNSRVHCATVALQPSVAMAYSDYTVGRKIDRLPVKSVSGRRTEPVTFSTNLVPASDRLAAWEWNARQFCGDCRFHFPNRRTFHGSIETKKLGNLELSLFSSSSLSFTKFPIRTSHSENHCTVITQLRGDRTYSQNGRVVTLRAGDSTLIDSALPWSSECLGDCMRLYVRTPRPIVEDLLRTKTVPSGSFISGSSDLGAALFQLANSLYHQADRVADEERAALIDAYFDTLADCVSDPKGNLRRAWHAPHLYLRVARFIEEHLANPVLGPTNIAAALGISTRHLHRLFANRGTTPGEWIRQYRLDRSRADLADPSLRKRSVTEIAFSWGFCDSAHFSHAFKKRFGMSPRAFRYQIWATSWNKTLPDADSRDFLAAAQQSEPN